MANILYCDDQERFLKAFAHRHFGYYEVTPVAHIGDVQKKLAGMQKRPDLLLLDLYHPKTTGKEQTRKAEIAEASLAELDAQIERTKVAVLDAWSPTGLELLKSLREQYSAKDLPIALYTQRGLLLLDDAELREAEQHEADWLLKKKSPDPEMERLWIDRILRHADTERKSSASNEIADRSRSALSKFRWVLIASWVLLAVSLTAHFVPTFDVGAITTMFLSAVVATVAALGVGRFLDPNRGPSATRAERT